MLRPEILKLHGMRAALGATACSRRVEGPGTCIVVGGEGGKRLGHPAFRFGQDKRASGTVSSRWRRTSTVGVGKAVVSQDSFASSQYRAKIVVGSRNSSNVQLNV